MSNPDIYLHGGLVPATDVELYPSTASGGTTTSITASTTAIGVASVTIEVVARRRFGGWLRRRPRRRPVVHRLAVAVEVTAATTMARSVEAHRHLAATATTVTTTGLWIESAEENELEELLLLGLL